MERPPADPRKLQATWDGWVAAESTPGRVVADFKTNGLRDVLEHWAEGSETGADPAAEALLASWMSWEKGENVPESLLKDLATGGLADRLAGLASAAPVEPA